MLKDWGSPDSSTVGWLGLPDDYVRKAFFMGNILYLMSNYLP